MSLGSFVLQLSLSRQDSTRNFILRSVVRLRDVAEISAPETRCRQLFQGAIDVPRWTQIPVVIRVPSDRRHEPVQTRDQSVMVLFPGGKVRRHDVDGARISLLESAMCETSMLFHLDNVQSVSHGIDGPRGGHGERVLRTRGDEAKWRLACGGRVGPGHQPVQHLVHDSIAAHTAMSVTLPSLPLTTRFHRSLSNSSLWRGRRRACFCWSLRRSVCLRRRAHPFRVVLYLPAQKLVLQVYGTFSSRVCFPR